MKRVSNRLVSFCAAIFVIAGSASAIAEPYTERYTMPEMVPVLEQPAGDTGSFCLDSMETVPFHDELMPIPVSVDGGCNLPEGPIHT